MTKKQLFNWDEITGNFYSNGWKKGAEIFEVKELATGEILASVGMGSTEQIIEATQVALAAQKKWVKVPPEEKRFLFLKAAEIIKDYEEEIHEWLIREVGAPRSKARFEIDFFIDEFLEAAAYPTQNRGMVLGDRGGRLSYSVRVPYGVCAGITPSNVPLTLGARFIAPALATGNAVLLKPHKNAIVCSGFVFARILEEAGFPKGLFHCIPAEGKSAEAFETNPNISMVHFTGSTVTGKRVAEAAARNLKKVSISGSGKNPFIVLDDVTDLDAVIAASLYCSFYFSGQVCMAAGRHLIQEGIFDRYVQKLSQEAGKLIIDDPWKNPKASYGPMTLDGAVDRMEEIAQDALKKGAKLHFGTARKRGRYFDPVILSGVKPGMRAWEEEIFGPIAPITTFKSDEEAVQLANDTSYGLSSAVFGSYLRATRIGNQIEAGMIHINDKSTDDAAYVPFGGIKQSGNGGRYGSYVNWDEYTQTKWFTVSDQEHGVPFGH